MGGGDEAKFFRFSIAAGEDGGSGEGGWGGVADEQGSEENVSFVDEVLMEEGGQKGGTAFEEEVGVIVCGEVREERFKLRTVLLIGGERKRHGAFGGELLKTTFGGEGKGPGMSDQDGGFGNGLYEIAGEREAAVGVENDACGSTAAASRVGETDGE